MSEAAAARVGEEREENADLEQRETGETWKRDKKQQFPEAKRFDDRSERKILRQLEFYFSESNLPRDKFLRELVERDEDRFVEMKTLLKFQRMRDLLQEFGGSNNPDVVDMVVNLLREKSKQLECDERGEMVRRKEDLRAKEEIEEDVEKRSLYANPFPMTSTIEELQDWFEKTADERVLSVRLRRHIASKDFKGSIFVEFETKDIAEKVKAMKLEHEGAELTLMFKREYLENKKDEKRAKMEQKAKEEADREANPEKYAALDAEKERAERAVVTRGGDFNNNERSNNNREKGNRDNKRRDRDDHRSNGAQAAVDDDKEVEYTPGMIARITLGEKANMDWDNFPKFREEVKSAFDKFGKIKFVDFKQGEKSGFLRFEDETVAAKIIEAITGGQAIEVEGDACSLNLLVGDEEKEYWTAIDKRAKERDRNSGNNNGDRRGGGRGDRRGGGGRGGGRGRGFAKRQRRD